MRSAPRTFIALTAILTASACAMVDHYTGEDVNKSVRENGIAATAEVLEVWDTGVRLNDNPVVGFRLMVTIEGSAPYEAEARNVVSVVHIPQVQPGAILPVRVDPDDTQRVALDIYEHQ